MPVATDELLAIAQSAGQLGVKGSDNILKFTETVAKLGTATDLSGDQAAMAFARILNVTGEALGTVDVLGSVIVALGNNFAATESQIAEMATVRRGAAVFGVSSAQASALAAALAAVGVKSEVAGTSIGRILRMIDAAIRSGGEHLAILTQITGRAAEEIKELFQRDAMAAFALFIDGLKRIGDAGGSVADAMAALGLADQRLLKTIPVLANRADLLAQALEIANRETENATALNEEAARAFESLNNQTEVMWNNIKSLARAIGADLAPGVSVAVQGCPISPAGPETPMRSSSSSPKATSTSKGSASAPRDARWRIPGRRWSSWRKRSTPCPTLRRRPSSRTHWTSSRTFRRGSSVRIARARSRS